MLKPKDICDQLGISAPTLRLWSRNFESVLSPSAQSSISEKGTALQRRYSDDDLAVFIRAKSLLDIGLKYNDVLEKLKTPETEPLPQLPAVVEARNGHSNGHMALPASVDLAQIQELLARSVTLQEMQIALLKRLDIASDTRHLIALQEEQLALMREECQHRLELATLTHPSTFWERLVAVVKP